MKNTGKNNGKTTEIPPAVKKETVGWITAPLKMVKKHWEKRYLKIIGVKFFEICLTAKKDEGSDHHIVQGD